MGERERNKIIYSWYKIIKNWNYIDFITKYRIYPRLSHILLDFSDRSNLLTILILPFFLICSKQLLCKIKRISNIYVLISQYLKDNYVTKILFLSSKRIDLICSSSHSVVHLSYRCDLHSIFYQRDISGYHEVTFGACDFFLANRDRAA